MSIEIKIDKTSDIDSFYENIFGENYIKKWGFIRKAIFGWYPQLGEKLDNITDTEERKKIIYEYIDGIYTKHDTKLQTIIQNLKSLFENNKEKIIAGLVTTMDFNPQDIPHMTIVPSLKPNSTFGTDRINLSIALEVFKDKANPYIDIFIHEITHIIWNQKIGKIYDIVGKLGSLAHEDLKEIVTPVIMRDSHFKNILQSEYMKNANEKQQLLQINVNGINHNIVDYFESIYQDMKGKSNTFEKIMKEFVKIFLKIEDQIIAKHSIYNEFGFVSKDKEEALKILKEKGYLDPIIMNTEIIVREQTADEEFSYLMRFFGNMPFYKEHGYNLSLPTHPIFLDIANDPDSLKSLDIKKLKDIFSNEIYAHDYFENGLKAILHETHGVEKAIERMKGRASWGFKIFPKYEIKLTAYGPGGSYGADTGNIIMKIKKDGTFSRSSPIHIIIHEMVHIGIEESLIRKFGMTHTEKEGIVDAICTNYFKDILVDYKIQELGDKNAFNLVPKEKIEDLPKEIEKYKEIA